MAAPSRNGVKASLRSAQAGTCSASRWTRSQNPTQIRLTLNPLKPTFPLHDSLPAFYLLPASFRLHPTTCLPLTFSRFAFPALAFSETLKPLWVDPSGSDSAPGHPPFPI